MHNERLPFVYHPTRIRLLTNNNVGVARDYIGVSGKQSNIYVNGMYKNTIVVSNREDHQIISRYIGSVATGEMSASVVSIIRSLRVNIINREVATNRTSSAVVKL